MDITDAKEIGYEARLVAKGNRGSFWQIYLAGQPIDDQEFGTEADAWTHAIERINADRYNG